MSSTEFLGTATYSPDDNKLRFYPYSRLEAGDYARIKEAGFKWAPKQELYVAPMWKPSREDLLLDWCGEIGDEDTSLVDRAEERADRFEGYQEKRAAEAERAHEAVSQICEHIPLGQPILVGHHSERRARKDAERIQNGMRKVVKLWETSTYWQQRAAGALRHAKYKELPTVRARRIKTIEADSRKVERDKAQAAKRLAFYNDPQSRTATRQDGSSLIRAMLLSWEYGISEERQKQLEAGTLSLDDAIAGKITSLTRYIAHCDRWIAHYNNRLNYEKAMLDEQGATDLLKPKARKEQLPLLNYRAPDGLMIENRWNRGVMERYRQIEMTKAEYAAIYSEYRGTREVEKTHRVRIAIIQREWVCVYITDSKAHERPEAKAEEAKPAEMRREIFPARDRVEVAPAPRDPRADLFEAAKDQLKAGVKVVAVPQLFATSADLAQRVVNLAGIEDGDEVLEPSAGTGALIEAVKAEAPEAQIMAVEINHALAESLSLRFATPDDRAKGICRNVLQADFLSLTPAELGKYDRIVMNPPFEDGADIKHIQHARKFLKSGGKLVALCANGPRQRRALMDEATHWEDLPAGSFKAQGTNVNVALVVMM